MRLAIGLGVVGLAVLLLSAFADAFGFAKQGFGWKQWLGVVLGAAVLAAGIVLAVAARRAPRA